MKRLVLIGLGAAAAATALPATAQDGPDNRLYIAPTVQYVSADSDRLVDDGIGFTMSVGKPITSGLNFELIGMMTELDSQIGGTTAEINGLGAQLLLFPSRGSSGTYGLMAVMQGFTDDHPATGNPNGLASYEGTIFDVGVGTLLSLGNAPLIGDVYARMEARYRFDSHDRREAGAGGTEGFYEGVLGFGLHIPLGPSPAELAAEKEAEEVALVEAISDSDNDGVADTDDQCPGTPSGAVVDSRGCERDSDGDGVKDSIDECPNTPAGREVNAKGCPLDTDGDGVLNSADQCPNTPEGLEVLANGCAISGDCRIPKPGEEVDENGCAVVTTVILRGVTFEFDKARLTANAKVILDQVADALLSVSQIDIELGGHTDSQGPQSYNQALSKRRAESVMKYLASRGVAESSMTAKGYGESKPIADNSTLDGRELNRRVELKILGESAGDEHAGKGAGDEHAGEGAGDEHAGEGAGDEHAGEGAEHAGEGAEEHAGDSAE